MFRRVALLLGFVIAALSGSSLHAQRLRGTVSDAGLGSPVAGAVVSVVDSTDQVAARAITDGVGTFSLIAPPRAARLRVIRIGYQPRDVMLVGDTSGIRISMARLPTTLAAMRVTGRELCPGSEDRGPAFQLWEQARAGLLATVVARESNPAEAERSGERRKVGSWVNPGRGPLPADEAYSASIVPPLASSLLFSRPAGGSMSDHKKPHNGRDIDGRYRVRQVDLEEVLEDPNGVDIVRDDVRLGGAVADIGVNAAQPALEIGEQIAENRENVDRVTGKIPRQHPKRARGRRR